MRLTEAANFNPKSVPRLQMRLVKGCRDQAVVDRAHIQLLGLP